MNYSNYRYKYTNEKFVDIDENTVVRNIKKLKEKGDTKKARALEKLLEEFWSFYP